VTGHLSVYKKGKSQGAVTPLGKADLLLSPDLLDGSQAISFLSKSGKALIDNDFQVPLSILLDRELEKDSLKEEKLRKDLKEKLGERLILKSLKEKSYEVFGKSVYASAMLLGLAYQAGRIPFTVNNLKDSFEKSLPKKEIKSNWDAFILGRKPFLGIEESFQSEIDENKESDNHYVESIKESLLPWEDRDAILSFFESTTKHLYEWFPEIDRSFLSQYAHDLVIYNRGKEGDAFLEGAKKIKDLYPSKDKKIMALRTWVRTFWIKDEVFVAHLMSTPGQHQINQKAYSQLGSSYKVTHINRPRFDIWGKVIEFDINPKKWMLKIMRHMRILRRFLPGWHQKEEKIAAFIRKQIIEVIPHLKEEQKRVELKKCENVKGYREVRYQKFEEYFGEV